LGSAQGAMCREMDVALAVERWGLPVAAATSVVPIQRMPSPQGSRLLKLAGRLHATLHPKPKEYLAAIWAKRRTLFVRCCID
jgi:hypothetical protein